MTELEKQLDVLAAHAQTLAKEIKAVRASLRRPKTRQRLAKSIALTGDTAFPPSRRPSRIGTRWVDAIYLALRSTPETPVPFHELCVRSREIRETMGGDITEHYAECIRSALRQHPESFTCGSDGWLVLETEV